MIQTLEELTQNAWPGLQTVLIDGWIARFAGGYTRRANSVLPLYPSRGKVDEKIAYCEALYHERGLPVVFKLPGRSESRALHDCLVGRGYRAEADTSVQTVDLRSIPQEVAGDVHMTAAQTQEWETAFRALSGLSEDQHALHHRILAAIVPRRCFASIQSRGQFIGCALGVLQDGYVGLYEVVVHPEYRRQGCGERLAAGLMAWARRQDAHTAYLQVMLNNPPALRLYERLGFREQYQYWYCVK